MKKEYKIYNIVLISLFCLLIVAPEIDRNTGIFSFIKSRENKAQISPPKIFQTPIDQFIHDFSAYYEVNFGMRDVYFFLYSNFKYFLLHSSPLPEKLVIGEEGWFFLGNSYSDIIAKAMDKVPPSAEMLEQVSGLIKSRYEQAQKNDMDYLVCIAPDKHTVYYNYLPGWCRPAHQSARTSYISDYLGQKSGVDVIDLKDKILLHKDSARLYHKLNSHWNGLGAYWGYYELITRLKKHYPEINPVEFSDVTLDTTYSYHEDLINMINLPLEECRIGARRTSGFKAIKTDQESDSIQFNPDNRKGKGVRYTNPEAEVDIKVLVFRDSYFTAMIPWFSEHFKESVYIFSSYDEKRILDEKPDLVIEEVVERNFEERFK